MLRKAVSILILKRGVTVLDDKIKISKDHASLSNELNLMA